MPTAPNSSRRFSTSDRRDPTWKICFLGLSITSSWGNGHATTYRGLLRELAALGHEVTFFERDKPWYRDNRDTPAPEGCTVKLYDSVAELEETHADELRHAHAVIVGSYVPEGVAVGRLVTSIARGITAFYDIDTPITLAKLERGDEEYLAPDLVPRYDLYLSFTGGPTLDLLEREYGAHRALPLYCSADPDRYRPSPAPITWDLGYLGTYSDDRQPALESLLLTPARRFRHGAFVVGGPSYPAHLEWPANVTRIDHVAPAHHPRFYCGQRFTLNVTRAAMVEAGYSPSVRLFEAAACGVPIVSDVWEGIETIFRPGSEILLARSTHEVLQYLLEMPSEEAQAIGRRARKRVLDHHTAAHRARELISYLEGGSSGQRDLRNGGSTHARTSDVDPLHSASGEK